MPFLSNQNITKMVENGQFQPRESTDRIHPVITDNAMPLPWRPGFYLVSHQKTLKIMFLHLVTLTFDLDHQTWPRFYPLGFIWVNLPTNFQVHTPISSAMRVLNNRQTHRHIDR